MIALALTKALDQLEQQIIIALIKNGNFSPYDIVPGQKTVRMGFYSLKKFFLTPKEQVLLWILWKMYGYKFTETTVQLHASKQQIVDAFDAGYNTPHGEQCCAQSGEEYYSTQYN